MGDREGTEARNILCIFKLVYGVGLRALRKLFMDINPTWSNQPSDAATFDRGKMKLNKEDEACFNSGDINKWDFSLMTTILLFSTSCALEISKRPGYDVALHELKKCRNKLLGHPSTDRMSDKDFNYFWPLLSNNFITLGADPNELAELKLKADEVLLGTNYYKQLFEAEQDKYNRREKKLDSMDRKLDILIAHKSADENRKPSTGPEDRSGPQWDEWLQLRDAIGDFDTQKNQYILVTDSVPQENLECFSVLRRVAWKMILDFDPMSEEEGFYHEFTSKEGQSKLVSMFTPAELNQSTCTIKSLLRKIDPNKTQWLFVNGRSDDIDGDSKEFSAWEVSSVKGINKLLLCCADPDTFDQLKPVICVILPFSDESIPHLEVTLSRLTENFSNLNLTFVAVDNINWPRGISDKFNVKGFNLNPKILGWGFKEVLDTLADRKVRMPTSHAGVTVDLSTRQYIYIKEQLEILYIGCEDLPEGTGNQCESQEQQENFLEQQRRSFLSGNQISFASLFDNHDARREIERDIEIAVQRLLNQRVPKPMIVEIRHSPGTGGSTIARRVLWDLHKQFPCVLLDISSHRYSDEDNTFVNELAERIVHLEEICNTTPLILIDGKQSGAIESLSNKLSRVLQNRGKRVVILRCLQGSKASLKGVMESCQGHIVFHVNVKLEESVTDIREFKSKYKEYIDTIDKSSTDKREVSGLCRVFHFPLLAMMEEFRPKLEKIIEDTFNELGGIQQEIAVVVAFLQKYSNLPTPALLLYEAFKNNIRVPETESATYEDIKELFSDFLINLMIPAKPSRSASVNPPESYTFQHPLVASLILERVYQLQKRDLFEILNTFLQFPIYQQEALLPLLFELFLYNKKGATEKVKFSILFEELKEIDSDRAADVFCKASEKLNDPVMYGNAARFCARKVPPSFPKAKELIERALQLHGSTSKGGPRYKNLCHTKGVVLHFEMMHKMKSGEIKDLKSLEVIASSVLEAHREARDFPPTHPHPLIGEVEVWLQCIKWIMNSLCDGDTEKTLKFVTNMAPPFFRTCISDCFNLLDIVDRIAQSVPFLADHNETKRLCNQLRLSLMKTCRRRYTTTSRSKADEDIVEACKAICTSKHFSASSQLELKRLKAYFILTHCESRTSIDGLKKANLKYLLELLEELVFKESEYHFAQHLIKVCMLFNTGSQCYSLEKGLHVCEKWVKASSHDCLPHFYKMVIFFLEILDGNSLEFMPKYIQALEKCQEKSQNDMRRLQATHYVGNVGQGMSRLVSRHTLLREETDYSPNNIEKASRFWQVGSRKKLLECKGRIRVKQASGRFKSQPYIELLQGKLELYVGKHADIGKVEIDFTPGALVYFVVSFNLQGPVANGITFSPQNASND